VARVLKANFTNCGHTVDQDKTTLYRLHKPDPRSWQGGLSMAKDGIDAMETSDGIARREFRSKPPAGTKAVAPTRGRPGVAKLFLT
jgi:hypothetical protein